MSKEKKKGFVLYYDYIQHLSLLSNEECGLLFKSLFEYGENGSIPQLEGAALMAFSFIKAQMDRDALKYEEICRKRVEAGRKGGMHSSNINDTQDKANDFSDKQTETNQANASFAKQTEANQANASFAKQTEANQADTDKDTDTDTDKEKEKNTETETEKETEKEKEKEEEKETETRTEKEEEKDTETRTEAKKEKETPPLSPSLGDGSDFIPYDELKELYHTICKSFPEILVMDESRKRHIRESWNAYKDVNVYKRLFNIAEDSEFLKGNNERGWKADFDWMIRPVNVAKIIEGRYNDIPKQSWENNKNNTPPKKKNNFLNYDQPTYSDEEWERILKLNEERFYIP